MLISEKGKDLLSQIEGGAQPVAYLDSGGELTIGVGHLLTHAERVSGKILIAGKWIKYRDGLTGLQMAHLLAQDLAIASHAVNVLVVDELLQKGLNLSQNQFDALVSFVYNIGVEAFRKSTLLRLLNNGDYASVPTQMKRWIMDNGVVVRGLINRRQKEVDMWNGVELVEV